MSTWQKPIRGATINRAHPRARGLVGCWLMNEGGADQVHDLTGNGNHGVLTNMVPEEDWVATEMGMGVNFDGTNDYVNVPFNGSMLRLSDALTCIAWVRVGNLSGNNGLIARYTTSGNQRCFRLILDINERMGGYFSSNGAAFGTWPTSTSAISQNAWHSLAWVKLPGVGTARNYIDGVLNNEGTISDGITSIYPSASAPLTIGMGYNTTGEPFLGDVARVLLYDRAFQDSEIKDDYLYPHAFVEWGLIVPPVFAAPSADQSQIIGESFSLSDSVGVLAGLKTTIADSLALTDTVVGLVAYIQAISDSASLSEALTVLGGYSVVTGDNISLSDAIVLLGHYSTVPVDSLSLSDTISLIGSYFATPADSVALSEALTVLGNYSAIPVDSISLSDAVVLLGHYFDNIVDNITLSDLLSVLGDLSVVVAEGFTLSDAVAVLGNFLVSPTDSMAVSDTALVLASYAALISEGLTLSDAAAILAHFFVEASDTMTFGEWIITGEISALYPVFDGRHVFGIAGGAHVFGYRRSRRWV